MRMNFPAVARLLPALLPIAILSACSHNEADIAAHDPGAPTNRTMFSGNMYVDHHVLRPVTRFYVADVPTGAQHGVHHFLTNLKEPQVLVNDVLQGNFSRSWNTVQRFTVNTTVGCLGIFDVAQSWGLPHHEADFGQTMGVWGVGTGPDLQLPLFGFSNVRDLAGKGVGIVTDPFTLITGPVASVISGASSGMGVVDGRSETLAVTDSVERDSLDEYATLRSMTSQHRLAFVQEGRQGKIHPANATISETTPGKVVSGS